jgi:serine/threonine protein phosphatase PrpC/TolA-binding protein
MMNNTFLLNISLETSSGNGEDCHLVYQSGLPKTFVFGVFDGLGGRSAGFDGLKGGQIASKKASEITKKILDQYYGELTLTVASEIQSAICHSLKRDADNKMQKSRLSGKLAGKRLCTTISLASITEKSKDFYEIRLTWMGDSRIYFLGANQGLQQLTFDDLEVAKDAFEMIREDPPMSQYLTADTSADWHIHYSTEHIYEKGCILACTDGCFQYLSTPWEFELLLLQTLCESSSISEWENALSQKYEQIKQDDVSLLMYFIGFTSFESIKEYYKYRLQYLFSLYENHDDKLTDFDNLRRVWNIYRISYEARLSSSSVIFNNEKNNLDTGSTVDSSEQNVESTKQFEPEVPISASSISSELHETSLKSNEIIHAPPLEIAKTTGCLLNNEGSELFHSNSVEGEVVEECVDSGDHAKRQYDGSSETSLIDIPPFLKQLENKKADIFQLYNKAKTHENNSEFEEAISQYQEILKVNKEHVDARYSLGELYFNLCEFQCAVQHFEKMPIYLLNDPTHNLMRIYVESLSEIGELEKAMVLCELLIQKNPSDPKICYLMGNIFHKQYFLKEAKDFLDRSKSIYKNKGHSSEQIKKIDSDLETIARKVKNKGYYNY